MTTSGFSLVTARQVLKNSGVGDAFNNIGKQLKDGHWVLAFPNVEAANYATLLVDQHAAKLRAYYCEVLPATPAAALEYQSSRHGRACCAVLMGRPSCIRW